MVEDGGEQLGGPFSVDVVLSTLATASKAHATPRRGLGAGEMAPNGRVVTRMEEVRVSVGGLPWRFSLCDAS